MKKALTLLMAALMLVSTAAGAFAEAVHYPDATDNPNVVAYLSEAPKGVPVTAVADTLTVAQGGEPNTLYPQEGNQIPAIIAYHPLYETLVVYNQFTNEFEPGLAESWEMIDDTTIRIHLRQGVLCHAGYEMTAEDVLWTAQKGAASSVANYLWGQFDVDNFEIVDKYTIDMKTKTVFGPLLSYLSDTSTGYIINKQAYEEQTPQDYARNPTGGSGPYKFVEWIAGDRIVYEAFDGYWGDKPYFKNLVIRNISDDATRAMALENGEVDVIYGVDTSSYQTLIDSPISNLITFPSYQLIHMGLNLAVKPFDDVRVRQAIRYALDLDAIVGLAFSGYADVADAPWPNSLSTYLPPEGDEVYDYNPEKAKELLAEAGYADGFTFSLWVADTTAWVQMAEMIQNSLAQVGITCNVTVMDQNTLLADRATGNYEAYIARFSCSSNETAWWRTRLHSEGDYNQNVVQYKNADVDEWLDAAQTSLDDAYRTELYQKVMHQWRIDQGWISLACPSMAYGIRSTLMGVEPHPYGTMDLRYIRPIDAQ
ncbi:MAG: ABC transporter substrate-binding protein [Clostridia bacterium]|nr:ABC transporter substrate-binding protein [Clostridia bacterium]